MSPNNNLNKILIIDFGSQFTQLIARRIREFGVFSEIISHKKINRLNIFKNVKGIILSGGPLSVHQNNKVKFNKKISKIIPAEGLAFLISAIIEILLLLILFSIFSLKLIKDLFSLILSFKESIDTDFFNMSIIPVLDLFTLTFLINILEFFDNKVSTIKKALELMSPGIL